MRCLIGELIPPENGESLFCPYCQNCERQRTCPYAWDQALRRAARQGHWTAQELTVEAERLGEIISRAGGVCLLLKGNRALECALTRALDREMDLIDDLRRSREGREAGDLIGNWR